MLNITEINFLFMCIWIGIIINVALNIKITILILNFLLKIVVVIAVIVETETIYFNRIIVNHYVLYKGINFIVFFYIIININIF